KYASKNQCNGDYYHGMLESWMVRNDKIFGMAALHLNSWKHYLKEGLQITKLRAKQAKAQQIEAW
uniref:Uncharacterized protein n=1 Tax=Triticum urartu TaxID=4572 RepID=A0A8R7JY23_TRIUA